MGQYCRVFQRGRVFKGNHPLAFKEWSVPGEIGREPAFRALADRPVSVGKTLITRCIAKESGFNVIEIRGPELLSKYMGESERTLESFSVRFEELAPTVLIVDSVDSFATSGWSDSKVINRIVNQLGSK